MFFFFLIMIFSKKKDTSTEFTLGHTKLSYIQCLQLELIRFSIDFDKCHEATDTVAEIENKLTTFKDH